MKNALTDALHDGKTTQILETLDKLIISCNRACGSAPMTHAPSCFIKTLSITLERHVMLDAQYAMGRIGTSERLEQVKLMPSSTQT